MIAPSPLIESMTRRSLDEVHAALRDCFVKPWDEQALREELVREWAHTFVLRPGRSRQVASFVCFWLVRDEAHILNVGTRPGSRRRGYGRLLLQRAMGFAAERGARYASLEVRCSNRPARALYDSVGFRKIGERPNYYTDDGEDACVMLADLPLE
jgi:ribosomal-protein-alanine N-acetyltransferase